MPPHKQETDIPFEYTYEYWKSGPREVTTITCLMPNGTIILLDVSSDATILEIKEVRISKFKYD